MIADAGLLIYILLIRMNIINSRIIKTSRPIINRSIETLTAYSCEMYIQSFKISHRGYVFFAWSANDSSISSLRYQANGRSIQVKETLTISLRMTSKNGTQLPLNSSLKLMAQTGEQLDQFEISMNTLTSQYKEMEIPMNRGLVNIKLRRKQMNIAEGEDINYHQIYRSKISKIEEKSINIAATQYQSLQEDLLRTKKELQDKIYINNKLNNDRDVLLATKHQLQMQIETILIQISKEISQLRQYYNNKIAIREHCYEEQIEDLVNLFNSNAQQSKKTVQLILRQKVRLQEEVRPMNQKIKIFQLQAKRINQLNQQIERENKQLKTNLQEAQQQIQKEMLTSTQCHAKFQEKMDQIDIKITDLNQQIRQLKKQKKRQEGTIIELEKKLLGMQLQSKQKNNTILQLQQRIIDFTSKQTTFHLEKQQLEKQVGHLQEEKRAQVVQIQELKNKLQQLQDEFQFSENVLRQQKRQQAQKEQQLYNQLQSLEHVYSQKMEDILAKFQKEKQQLLAQNKNWLQKEHQYLQTIKELEDNIKGSQIQLNQLGNEINSLENQIKSNRFNEQEKAQMIQKMENQIHKLKQASTQKQFALQKKQSVPIMLEQSFGRANNPQQDNAELKTKIAQLEQLIKTLTSQNERYQEELKSLKKQYQKIQSDRNRDKGLKQSKNSRKSFEEDMDQSVKIRSFNQEEVRSIVNKKQKQIKELRKRVEYLQDSYNNLQITFNEISKKYPQVDLAHFSLGVPKIQEWCESEQQQQKILNQELINNTKGLIKNNSGQSLHSKHSEKPILKSNHSSPYSNTVTKKINKIKRTDSIAEAIIQREDQGMWNNRPRKSFEPRSENRINDYNNIQKRQSLGGVGRVTIQIPQSEIKLKKDNSFGSYDHSQRSGTSYIKVSHSKKIKDLEQEIKNLFEKEKGYQAQISDYIKQIESLKAQISQLKRDIKQKLQLKVPAPKLEKVNTESQVLIEDERFKSMMQKSQLKQLQMQRIHLRVGELENAINRQKEESSQKIRQLQAKRLQGQRRAAQVTKGYQALQDTIKQLNKIIQQLQQKLRRQKQSSQQARLSLKQHHMQLTNTQNQLKKYKTMSETLQQKVQKLSGGELMIRELTRQLEDFNKKSLDQTRTINHLKLEKDALEEELRLIKKRQNDYLRVSTQWQEKAASLDRAIEQQKRKEGKLRREIEQGQQQVRRAKQNTKKAQQQVQALNSAQSTWQSERRKHLDQISTLQDQLSKKDYQLTRLNKQIQKWKGRAQEKDEMRVGKKSELREQIDRLEGELIRREKKILQQTQQNKLLRSRLELLQRQNKRVADQKNQTYGEKLKYYVDEMSNIKKLLEQYQNENSRLKVDNNEFYEQLSMLQINYQKLQIKYDQNMEREESILTDLQSYIDQVNSLKDRLASAHAELHQSESAFINTKRQLGEEKLQSKKIAQRLEVSERNLQRAGAEIRELKIKISQSQTNNEVNSKIGERFKALERKKNEVQEQYRRIKSQYDNFINIFIYKRQDLQKAVSQARSQQKRLREQQVQRVNEQCSKTILLKTQRLQQEICDAYNDNNKLRTEVQFLQDENGHQKGRISELQALCTRYGQLHNQNQANKTMIEQLKEQVRKRNEKIGKLQISIQGIQAESNTKQRQLVAQKKRIQELEKTLQKLNSELQTAKNSLRQMQAALLQNSHVKNRQKSEEQFQLKQRQFQLIQQYQSKIRNYELEIQRLKQKEARSGEEYVVKMRKLQQKMDEMQQALRQKEKALEGNYQAAVQEIQGQLIRLSQELQQKLKRIDDLNQAIIILQGQNKDYAKEMQQCKYQHQQERHILQSEISRLKSKLKEQAQAYQRNIKSLQEDLLRNRLQGNNTSNSRIKANEEERITKRYEQKIKNKDKKIEQLKDNIYTLEQTILKLKKKEQSNQTYLTEIDKLKVIIIESQKQRKIIEAKYEQQLNRDSETIRGLRHQMLLLKQSEQKLRLVVQQRTFQNQSIECQLKTIRQLYLQLQRELQKRKNNLTAQLEEQSSLQLQLRNYESKLAESEEKLIEAEKRIRQLQIQLKKKGLQLKRSNELNSEYVKKEQTYAHQISKMNQELTLLKKHLQQATQASQNFKAEVGKNKAQLVRLRKSQQEMKLSSKQSQQAATEARRLYEQLHSRYREYQQNGNRYIQLNERTRHQLGLGIEQAVERFITKLQDRQDEYNQLIYEIEQLKFMNDCKFKDYDQLKRENFQLTIKVEDLEVLSDQVDTLRKICDRLEDEKKSSVFREEVLRLQLQSLANTVPELKTRIDSILSAPTMPSYTNFSFY